MSRQMLTKLLADMNILGYRVYSLPIGKRPYLYGYDIIRYIGLPELVFVKEKIVKNFG